MKNNNQNKPTIIPKQYIGAFILVTSLFALWGFANDITNPLVAAFKAVFDNLSNAQSSTIQFAFYGGYATMAIPAALFIQRYSYKAGILLGLALYATGALLFIPAANTMQFIWFPLSLTFSHSTCFSRNDCQPLHLILWEMKRQHTKAQSCPGALIQLAHC